MTRLSVNINKIATLRNARGGNMPNVLAVAADCEKFGAEGIITIIVIMLPPVKKAILYVKQTSNE